MKNIEAAIVADSVNPDETRITSFLLTYPRLIHSELMTHRVFSRNAASSRAIPISKMIAAVRSNPATFEQWGSNGKGMQAKGILGPDAEEAAKSAWSTGKLRAIETAETLHALGAHKQIANRVLEPWLRISVLVTATDYDNFFALRAHKDAQPEFQVLAFKMLNQYLKNKPKELPWGHWHAPLVQNGWTNYEGGLIESVANCARVSYTKHDGEFGIHEQRKLVDALALGGHWSPFEHQAQAVKNGSRFGNFAPGWMQYRKKFLNENRKQVDLQKLLDEKPDWVQL